MSRWSIHTLWVGCVEHERFKVERFYKCYLHSSLWGSNVVSWLELLISSVWILKWHQASIFGHSRGSRRKFWIPSFLKICRQAFTSRVSLHSPGYAYWLDQIWGLTDNLSFPFQKYKTNPLSTPSQEQFFSHSCSSRGLHLSPQPKGGVQHPPPTAGAAHFTLPAAPRPRRALPSPAPSVCSRLSEQEASPEAWSGWNRWLGIHRYSPCAEPKVESPHFC